MNQNKKPDLSIIIPVKNEKENFDVMINILESTIKINHEILVIYDNDEDTTLNVAKQIEKKYENIILVKNNLGIGVTNAIKSGIKFSKSETLLVTVIDEIFPIISINDMYKLIIEKNCDLVSGTRYSLGGKRYGGSLVGHILSKTANIFFKLITGSIMSDCTTGIKMFKKNLWERINPESDIGWSFAFELSIKSQLYNYKIGEVPIISVDRLFGGKSSFLLKSWIKGYLKWNFKFFPM